MTSLTSIEIFAIVVGLVFGYLIVSHFMSPKPGAPESAPPPAPDQESAQTWDAVLMVSRYAPPDAIRQAYRAQIAKYHPDKVAALGDEFKEIADRKSKEINTAYAAACHEKGM